MATKYFISEDFIAEHIITEDCLFRPVKSSAVYKEVYLECIISVHLAQINSLVSL